LLLNLLAALANYTFYKDVPENVTLSRPRELIYGDHPIYIFLSSKKKLNECCTCEDVFQLLTMEEHWDYTELLTEGLRVLCNLSNTTGGKEHFGPDLRWAWEWLLLLIVNHSNEDIVYYGGGILLNILQRELVTLLREHQEELEK
jgi:hypothetical protein